MEVCRFVVKSPDGLVVGENGVKIKIQYISVYNNILSEIVVGDFCFKKKSSRVRLENADVIQKLPIINELENRLTPQFDIFIDAGIKFNTEHLGDIKNGSLKVAFHPFDMVACHQWAATADMAHKMVKGIPVVVPYLNRHDITVTLKKSDKVTG